MKRFGILILLACVLMGQSIWLASPDLAFAQTDVQVADDSATQTAESGAAETAAAEQAAAQATQASIDATANAVAASQTQAAVEATTAADAANAVATNAAGAAQTSAAATQTARLWRSQMTLKPKQLSRPAHPSTRTFIQVTGFASIPQH